MAVEEHSAFWHCLKWGRMVAAALVVKIWGGNVWKQFGSSEMGAECVRTCWQY